MQYIIIYGHDVNQLQIQVEQKLMLGWVLQGGVTIGKPYPKNITQLYQAMTKMEKPNE